MEIVEPAEVKDMDKEGHTPNSICSILRNIYHRTTDEDIKFKCRVATTMAKNMAYRLREYKDARKL